MCPIYCFLSCCVLGSNCCVLRPSPLRRDCVCSSCCCLNYSPFTLRGRTFSAPSRQVSSTSYWCSCLSRVMIGSLAPSLSHIDRASLFLLSALCALFPTLRGRTLAGTIPRSASFLFVAEHFPPRLAILAANHCVLRSHHLHRACLSLLASRCDLPSSP